MYEDIIKKIEEKEKELGIEGGYKNWTNEMFEFIHQNKYDAIEIYDIIIGDNVRMPVTYSGNMPDTLKWLREWEGKRGVGIYNVEGTYVYKSMKDDCDIDFCKVNNIPIIEFGQPTGTFVISDGSLSFAYDDKLLLPIENQYIFRKIAKFLGADINVNDYLIQGYKVAGLGHTMGHLTQHYSFTVDIDLIRNICKKKMEKVPRGITELTGITRQEFIDWLKTWLFEE